MLDEGLDSETIRELGNRIKAIEEVKSRTWHCETRQIFVENVDAEEQQSHPENVRIQYSESLGTKLQSSLKDRVYLF